MKKNVFMALALACAFTFTLSACGSDSSNASSDASGEASADASADASGDVEKPEYNALDYVNLGEYMRIEVSSPKYEATQDDYDEYVADMLDSSAEYVESDKTTVEDGDMVNIDYVGTVDGEEFDGGSAEGYDLEIGSGSFIDDFEEQLIGAKVGDTVEVNVTFPDDYSEELSGKDAVFTCTINSIKEEQVPEYTDDFVNEYSDGEYTTTEAYDEYIWDELNADAEKSTQDALDEAVKEAVYAVCEVNGAPEGLFEYYFAQYRSYYESMADAYGYDLETLVTTFMGYESLAELDEDMTSQINDEIIPETLIAEALVENMNIDVTDEILDNYIAWYASEYYGFDDVDTFYSTYGLEGADDFTAALGEDIVKGEAAQYEMWNIIKQAAVVTYTEPEEEEVEYVINDESSDAEIEDEDEGEYEIVIDDEEEN